jgi:mannosyltransferase
LTVSRGGNAPAHRWRLYAIRLGLAVVAIPIAVYDLGRSSFNLDEGTTFAITFQNGSAFASGVAHDGGSMLFYYTLLHVASIAGLPASAAAMRSLSVLPFICLGPVVFEIGRRLGSSSAGIIAALFVLLNTELVGAAQSARSYSFVVLFVTLSFLALLLDQQRPSRQYRFLWLGTAVLATYCHELAVLFVGAQAAWALAQPTRAATRRQLLPYLGAYAVSCVPLMWLAYRRGAQQISWILPLNLSQVRDLVSFLFKSGGTGDARLLLAVLMTLACLAGAVHALRGWPQRDQPAEWGRIGVIIWAIIPILLAILISAVQPILTEEYYIEVLPAVAILAADGIVSLGARTSKAVPIAVSVVIIGLLAYTLVPAYGQSEQDFKAATTLISENGSPDDGIVFLSPDSWNAVDYYLLTWHDYRSAPTSVFPATQWTRVADYARDPWVPSARMLECAVTRYKMIWLVIANTSTSAQYTAIKELTSDFAVRRSHIFNNVQVERLSVQRISRPAADACV